MRIKPFSYRFQFVPLTVLSHLLLSHSLSIQSFSLWQQRHQTSRLIDSSPPTKRSAELLSRLLLETFFTVKLSDSHPWIHAALRLWRIAVCRKGRQWMRNFFLMRVIFVISSTWTCHSNKASPHIITSHLHAQIMWSTSANSRIYLRLRFLHQHFSKTLLNMWKWRDGKRLVFSWLRQH